MSTGKKDEFLRISGDSDFQDRSSSIFGSLDRLEPEQKSETESKTVSGPQAGCRAPKRVPDHVLHPEKWTKYSLEDDGTDKNTGMTGDALNRHVALSFMDEIRKRKVNQSKHAEKSVESDVVMSEKHVFSKSAVKHKKVVDEVAQKSKIVEGVNVMPEYVIGASQAKISKKEQKTQPADKKLHFSPADDVHLGHLEEKETTDTVLETSKILPDPVREQQHGVKFAKRKVKSRSGLREHKPSTEDG